MLRLNGNHEITTQRQKREKIYPPRDLNHSPLELKASVLPLSYTESKVCLFLNLVILLLIAFNIINYNPTIYDQNLSECFF